MRALAGADREAGLLYEATVTDGETDLGNAARDRRRRTIRHDQRSGRRRDDERHRQRGEERSGGAGVHLWVVRVGTAAVVVARGRSGVAGRAIQARVRCTARFVPGRHGLVVMPGVHGMLIVLVVSRRLRLHNRVDRMRHDARHDGCLQPRRAKQREHHPGQGMLPSSHPAQAEFHVTYQLPAAGEPYPLRPSAASTSAAGPADSRNLSHSLAQ